MFKIAYNAGHILATPGKRMAKEIDPAETREWVLNDRVARYFEQEMKGYKNVELMRFDDPKGVAPIDIDVRVANANEWMADFYLSIHHNAAGVLFNGGGIECYIDGVGGYSEDYAYNIYNELIAETGLRGNRSDPIRDGSEAPLYETRMTNMPAVLVELGYMDSFVDGPIIMTDAHARNCAIAIARGIAKVAKLEHIEGFVDVEEGSYYEEAVKWAVENGITAGIDEYHFAPDRICTRAEAMTFLWRYMNQPSKSHYVNPFVDVKEPAYYYKPVLWAYNDSITAGVDETHFAPSEPCTRGQIVTFLWRMRGSLDCPAVHGFVDVPEDAFFAKAVAWADTFKVTSGVDETHFAPNVGCTRAQIVTFLYRLSQ